MVAMSTPPVPAAPTPRSILEDLVLTPVPGYSGRYGVVVDDGWRVLHVTGALIKSGVAAQWVEQALKGVPACSA